MTWSEVTTIAASVVSLASFTSSFVLSDEGREPTSRIHSEDWTTDMFDIVGCRLALLGAACMLLLLCVKVIF